MRKTFDLSVYFIADPDVCLGRAVLDVIKEAVEGGVTMVQYRNKTGSNAELLRDARAISQFLKPLRIPFIVNDHVGIASQSGADGVHLGQSDASPAIARRALGGTKIIGVTAFEPAHFMRIDPGVVDYAGTGPIYPTLTKPDKRVLGLELFSTYVRMSRVPVVGVGDITPERAGGVILARAAGVGMMRGISENPEPANAAAAYVRNVRKAQSQVKHDHPEYPQYRRV